MKILYSQSDAIQVDFQFMDEDAGYYKGKKGELLPQLDDNKVIVGLGKKDDFNLQVLQEAVYALGKDLNKREITAVALAENPSELEDQDYAEAVVEALYLSQYRFDAYLKEKFDGLEDVYLPETYQSYESALTELVNVLESQKISRDLVNRRSNDLTPTVLAEEVERIFSDLPVEVNVYGPEEAREKGFTAFLEVARGSDEEPRVIVMEYKQGGTEQATVFVGKGITYDTGGYSLKPSSGMETMHCDMGGAGTVIGAIRAIALNQKKANVVGIVAATENAVSGKAYKPGEVITARNGMTIEVENTDAEGRLTLADAVNYGADVYDPELLVDLATLTGACLVAFGETYTAAVTNNADALSKLQKAADQAREKIWELPNDPYFKESFKSGVADLKNTGGRDAGTITAGQFIEYFVEDKPWVHLDIAGTAYLSKAQGMYGKGATGIHVKTLYNLV